MLSAQEKLIKTSIFFVLTFQIALDTAYWTVYNHITIWGSIAVFFLLQFSYSYIVGGAYIGSLATVNQIKVFKFCSLRCLQLLYYVTATIKYCTVQKQLSNYSRFAKNLPSAEIIKLFFFDDAFFKLKTQFGLLNFLLSERKLQLKFIFETQPEMKSPDNLPKVEKSKNE